MNSASCCSDVCVCARARRDDTNPRSAIYMRTPSSPSCVRDSVRSLEGLYGRWRMVEKLFLPATVYTGTADHSAPTYPHTLYDRQLPTRRYRRSATKDNRAFVRHGARFFLVEPGVMVHGQASSRPYERPQRVSWSFGRAHIDTLGAVARGRSCLYGRVCERATVRTSQAMYDPKDMARRLTQETSLRN